MTSKEALERISNIELYHKEIYEDEDFEGDWTYEETCEYDGLVCEVYKQEIDTIKQDLERLRRLQQELKVCEYFERNLIQENEKLKKAIEILKYKLIVEIKQSICGDSYYLDYSYSCFVDNNLTQQEYELLKEVLDNEIYK